MYCSLYRFAVPFVSAQHTKQVTQKRANLQHQKNSQLSLHNTIKTEQNLVEKAGQTHNKHKQYQYMTVTLLSAVPICKLTRHTSTRSSTGQQILNSFVRRLVVLVVILKFYLQVLVISDQTPIIECHGFGPTN